MKKILTTAFLVLTINGLGLASPVEMSGKVTEVLKLKPQGANEWTTMKGRVNIKFKVDEDNSFFLQTKIEANSDIAWAAYDFNFAGGRMYINKVELPMANYGGGIYQNNTMYDYFWIGGKGLQFQKTFDNYSVTLLNAGGAIDKNSTNIYGVKIDTKIADVKIAYTAAYGTKAEKGGLAMDIETSTIIDKTKLSGQFFMDLSDDAAYGLTGALKSKQRTCIGLFGEYNYGMGKLYSDFVFGMSDQTKKDIGNSEISIGASYNLTNKVALYGEMILTDKNSTTSTGASIGLEGSF